MRATKAYKRKRTNRKASGIAPFSSNQQLATSNYPAFTLTEILIVIGIIVLMLALAVPAFNFITGSRSQNGAENVISAMLGRARSYAITNNLDAGVVFFLDPVTQRTTMAIVTRGLNGNASGSTPAEDAYYNYRGWTSQSWSTLPGAVPVFGNTQYQIGHEVIWPVADSSENKLLVTRSVHDASNTSATPMPAVPSVQPWTGTSGTASSANAGLYVDLLPDSDFQVLPPGVGCQLINDPKHPTSGTGTNADRYVRTGVIMFDPQGRLESIPIAFHGNSLFGAKLTMLPTDPDVPNPNRNPDFYSQLGVILFDKEAFLTKGFSETDAVLSGTQYVNGSATDENHEEQLLDLNSTPLYLDRYNGTVLKGE